MYAAADGNTTVVLYSFIYFFFAACFVAPPTEFVYAGVTIQNIFSGFIGIEGFNFVYHHLKRTALTLVLHSLIPLVYCIGLPFFAPHLDLLNWNGISLPWAIIVAFSLVLPVVAVVTVVIWCRNDYKYHPLVQQLSKLAGESESWRAVASSINIEFRRIDKFTSGTPSRLIAVTDSWIIKCCTYFVYVSHQNDIHLTLSDAEEHPLSYQSQGAVQYLNISVGGIEGRTLPFSIRLNSFEMGDLREKLQRPVRNARNIMIHQSLSDRFLAAFRQQVRQNAAFSLPAGMEVEQCIGCMQKVSDVKLNLLCRDGAQHQDESRERREDSNACQQCFCRPMWCLECMGKWFASRQDQHQPETWLSSQSPCPTCRARFCVLDVCPLQGLS